MISSCMAALYLSCLRQVLQCSSWTATDSSLFEMLPKEFEDSRWKLFPSFSKKILHIWHCEWVIMTVSFRIAIWLQIWDALRGIVYALMSQTVSRLALGYFEVAWIIFFGLAYLAEHLMIFLLLLITRDGMLMLQTLNRIAGIVNITELCQHCAYRSRNPPDTPLLSFYFGKSLGETPAVERLLPIKDNQ